MVQFLVAVVLAMSLIDGPFGPVGPVGAAAAAGRQRLWEDSDLKDIGAIKCGVKVGRLIIAFAFAFAF